MIEETWKPFTQACERVGLKPPSRWAEVSIAEQRLRLVVNGAVDREYVVSTSEKPSSCAEGSFGTPWGLHRVAEKIGDGLPNGAILKGRQATGQNYRELSVAENQAENLITTRILWLEGLEDGLNRGEGIDSHARYIYLHGTNREDRLGTRQSHGCVLLANADVAALYDELREGDLVWIGRDQDSANFSS